MNVADRTLTISVDVEDIERGEQGSIEACPIALAVRGAWQDDDPDSGVTVHGLAVVDWHNRIRYALPPIARDFITTFDAELGPVAPFTFTLFAPEPLE